MSKIFITRLFMAAVVITSLVIPNFASADTTATMTITKQVKNVTTGSVFSKQAAASKNDFLEFEIKVKNTSANTATSVAVADGFSGAASVFGPRLNISVSRNFSGTLTNTTPINFSTIEASGEVVIRYQVQVVNPSTNAQACNTASVSGTNVGYASDTACVSFNTPVINTQTTITVDTQVRNITQNSIFADSVNGRGSNALEYRIKVKNTGTLTALNVRVNDSMSVGNLIGAKFNYSVNRAYTGTLDATNSIVFATLEPSAEAIITYQASVNTYNQSNTPTVCTTAVAVANNAATVSDQACVVVYPNILDSGTTTTTTGFTYSLKALNDTKNIDATAAGANREDFITYTASITNTGAAAAAVTPSIDLAGVLPFADLVEFGGGVVSNKILTFPQMTIAGGQVVTKQFRVRVNYALPDISYVMTATYGNTVKINIPKKATASVGYVAPKTGSNTQMIYAILLGLLLASGAMVVFNKDFRKLLFA